MHQGSTGGLYDLVQSLYQVTPEIQQKLTSQFEKINHHPSTCTIERNIYLFKSNLSTICTYIYMLKHSTKKQTFINLISIYKCKASDTRNCSNIFFK